MSTPTMESGQLDGDRIEAFAGKLFGTYTAGMLTTMIDIGYRTGLFEALAGGSATSEALADRAGLNERYVREWLGSMVTGGIVDYDPATLSYTLPPEHAICLTGEGSMNLAPFSKATTVLSSHVKAAAEVFRTGGGIPYEEFRPEFTEVMDGMSRGLFDSQLVEGIVPLTGLGDSLATGIRVADIGCGTGHSTNVLASAYPASTFIGYDIGPDAIESARAEAVELGLSNVSFELLDIAKLPSEPGFGAVFAFDVIHDQVDPATVLERVFAALAPGGVFAMMDIKASSNLEDNTASPFAALLYGVSTLLHDRLAGLRRSRAGHHVGRTGGTKDARGGRVRPRRRPRRARRPDGLRLRRHQGRFLTASCHRHPGLEARSSGRTSSQRRGFRSGLAVLWTAERPPLLWTVRRQAWSELVDRHEDDRHARESGLDPHSGLKSGMAGKAANKATTMCPLSI